MAIPELHMYRVLSYSTISDIVREHVDIHPKGQKNNGEWIGLCPFLHIHKERTPSFSVTDRKGFYYCFGCGQFGTVVDFLKKFKQLTFEQSILYLAERYKVKIPSGKTNNSKKKLKDRQRRRKVVAKHQRKKYGNSDDILF